MPPQSVEVTETIIALKKALRREKEAPSNQPISGATNRGNKLKKGAEFVHAGSLPYRYTQHGSKERIEHAGYQRYIVSRNPKRYSVYGDELDDSESDEQADADADDENPYSEVRLEELLKPLTHPSELANHPSLNQPYLDPALPDMVRTTEEKLRQERANLWRAKNLYRHFIGDESWIPCVAVEQANDWDLFGPMTSNASRPSSGKKRKRGGDVEMLENGTGVHDYEEDVVAAGPSHDRGDITMTNGDSHRDDPMTIDGEEQATKAVNNTLDVESDQAIEPQQEGDHPSKDIIESNGVDGQDDIVASGGSKTEQDAMLGQQSADTNDGNITTTIGTKEDSDKEEADAADADADAEESPAPPPRRITRALAATNTSNTATPPLSPISSTNSSADSSTLYQPHPIFLLPHSIQISHSTDLQSKLPLHVANSGLPSDEIIETRRLLGLWIQKQEETIRGLEGVLGKLIKAKRMREHIWAWSKAEGHVGEWSDGEDWVDIDAWGINPSELRKGRDEEANEEEEIGRKGKRRRARERE